MGANVAGDMARGRIVNESLEEHGRLGAANLADKTAAYLHHQRGRGKKRPITINVRARRPKKQEIDIFDKSPDSD